MSEDRYHYFRIEARELLEGLGLGVVELERGQAAAPTLERLRRQAHTLKGAARVVDQPAIAEAIHRFEDGVAALAIGQPPGPSQLGRLREALEACGAALARLTRPSAAAERREDETLQTIRIARAHLDGLLITLAEGQRALEGLDAERGELAQADTRLRRLAEASDPAAVRREAQALRNVLDALRRDWGERLSQARRELVTARAELEQWRLVTLSTIFPQIELAAHDAAQGTGKRLQFEATGGEIALEGTILSTLRDALLHVVRNAADHGLELPAERLQRGKSPAGLVRVDARRIGHRVRITCQDDGRGLDAAAIARRANEQGLLGASETAEIGLTEASRLIFQAGMSTRERVTQISGRGIGLDAVRASVEAIGGEIAVESAPGQGTTLAIELPVSLSALDVLWLEAASLRAAVPLEAIVGVFQATSAEVRRTGTAAYVLFGGEWLPLRWLAPAFGLPDGETTEGAWPVVVLRGAPQVGLAVTRLGGVGRMIMQPLPGLAGRQPLVMGVALDAGGLPRPVIDPRGVIAAEPLAAAPAAPSRAPRVLVVDDSLTTRMLQQAILEDAGYRVSLAASAEEALALLDASEFALFVVDVEMPGMDGFALVARLRQHARLGDRPVAMLTSRQAPEDRNRALAVGATAYLIKGEFERTAYLATVRELVGA